ncbi:MAG: SDR family NAD(P)-dependent oxidoreductase, partial [Myxococcota bacterium]
MSLTILVTGATDGIGRLTAKKLSELGHTVLIHGRNPQKLQSVVSELPGESHPYAADLSPRADVDELIAALRDRHSRLDVLINNAGVLKTPTSKNQNGLDLRFVVNTLSPYLIARGLVPIMPTSGRIVNVSSAAQAPIDPEIMLGAGDPEPMEA